MDDLFHRLESRIQALALYCEHLKQANTKLKQTTFILQRDKQILWNKHHAAVTQIEAMVTRLKSIEEVS